MLSILFSVYPIHITIEYTKANRPLPIQQRKILMTWFYLVLWDNMTFIISNYPLVRIAGYVTIVMKRYEDSQWTVGDFVIEKHGQALKKLKKCILKTAKVIRFLMKQFPIMIWIVLNTFYQKLQLKQINNN